MKSNKRFKLVLLLMATIAVAACSTAPPSPGLAPDDGMLHTTGMDLTFATEFPVADKADAMARAARALSAGDINRALFFYVRALQFDSRDSGLLTEIGKIHHAQNRPDMAVRAFTLALQIEPDNLAALEGRGLIFLANDRDAPAEADLRRAVAISPRAWRAHNGLGILADQRGDHLVAAAHYDSALDIVPESAILLNNRGYSSFLAGDYRSATSDLHMAAGRYGYKRAWLNLGAVYAHEGRYIPAVDMYLKVLSEAETYNRVAKAAMANNDYEIAQQFLEQALYESPTYFPAAEENLSQLRLLMR